MNQKAYLEVESGLIYTVLCYTDESVYISWVSSPYKHNDQSIRNDYFQWLTSSGTWKEMKKVGVE